MSLGNESPSLPETGASRLCASPRAAGFTMVELAVTAACLALLASALLAVPRTLQNWSRHGGCLNHLRSLGAAAQSFASEHDGRLQLAADQLGVDIADPNRELFAYGGGELLAWPVVLAQSAGLGYEYNWDWGVRANSFAQALERQAFMADDFSIATCPADTVKTSTPYFPRGSGLHGNGDPDYPVAPTVSTAYWGRLSYAVNEDIVGIESQDGPAWPACWRTVACADDWCECLGGYAYGPSSPCFGDHGSRLRGRLDDVYEPESVALFVEAGPNNGADLDPPGIAADYANLIPSIYAHGPGLADAQQQHPARIPTNRHPGGRINVLFADFHARPVHPIEYDADSGLPSTYRPRVRVSPYDPHGMF